MLPFQKNSNFFRCISCIFQKKVYFYNTKLNYINNKKDGFINQNEIYDAFNKVFNDLKGK